MPDPVFASLFERTVLVLDHPAQLPALVLSVSHLEQPQARKMRPPLLSTATPQARKRRKTGPELPTAPLNQYQHLHSLPPEHFSIVLISTAHGNDIASSLRRSKVGKRVVVVVGGGQAVDQGREDGGATSR
ncbi:hypothetical protein PAMP_024179 [Pampus punctatissimus]